jgi:hypothetical protein
MTQSDIIRMAREAGWEMDDSCVLEPQVVWYISQGQLERFANLIAAAERKDCADIAEYWCCNGMPRTTLADQIRARGQS